MDAGRKIQPQTLGKTNSGATGEMKEDLNRAEGIINSTLISIGMWAFFIWGVWTALSKMGVI